MRKKRGSEERDRFLNQEDSDEPEKSGRATSINVQSQALSLPEKFFAQQCVRIAALPSPMADEEEDSNRGTGK